MSLEQFVDVTVKPWMNIGCNHIVSRQIELVDSGGLGYLYRLPAATPLIANTPYTLTPDANNHLSFSSAASLIYQATSAAQNLISNAITIQPFNVLGAPFPNNACAAYDEDFDKKFTCLVSGYYNINASACFRYAPTGISGTAQNCTMELFVNDAALPDISGFLNLTGSSTLAINGDYLSGRFNFLIYLQAAKKIWLSVGNGSASACDVDSNTLSLQYIKA